MNFHILTLFPDMIMQGLSQSIIGRAAEKGLLSIEAVNIRDYTLDKHKKVDDYPYGGGAGMLMQAQPVYDAWKSVADRVDERCMTQGIADEATRLRTVYLTPQGQTFTQNLAKELAQEEELVLLCGHYEGIDERVLEEIVTDYVSIGDYVLTGGELPAMVMVDAIARMVPGVLNNDVSGVTESFEGDLLEYPQYSRPEEWMGKRVPEVLLSGNQKKINAWRLEEAEKRTKERRPDLYEKYQQLQTCKEILRKQKLLHIDMIELITRGQARLVYMENANICLQDKASGTYFHTATNLENGCKLLEIIAGDAREQKREGTEEKVQLLTLHQDFMLEPTKEILGLREVMACYQATYTRREKLSITGLYSLAGAHKEGQVEICRLLPEHVDKVCQYYDMLGDVDETRRYAKERIQKGWMFGAFLDQELVGFIGMHTEGSIGMLTVLPEYRGRGIGKALETYIINLSLEQGFTPFGQVEEQNEVSKSLQESLGLCFAKQKIYFLEQK